MLDILLDTLLDAAKMLPFLFISYLVIEFIENRAGEKSLAFIDRSGKWGPAIGGALGIVPQCGFSSASAGLYAGGVITRGTLLAVFLSTSDEMLPILISERIDILLILKILAVKFICGMAVGFAVDFIVRRRGGTGKLKLGEFCDNEHCGCEEGGILKPAISHTLRIIAFVFCVSLVLNIVISYIGEDRLADFILNKPVAGELLAGLVGLVPGCAGSVVITQLYLSGGMSAGAMLAGLLVGSGAGILVLLRTNRHMKDNVITLSILYVSGVVLGLLFGLLPIF